MAAAESGAPSRCRNIPGVGSGGDGSVRSAPAPRARVGPGWPLRFLGFSAPCLRSRTVPGRCQGSSRFPAGLPVGPCVSHLTCHRRAWNGDFRQRELTELLCCWHLAGWGLCLSLFQKGLWARPRLSCWCKRPSLRLLRLLLVQGTVTAPAAAAGWEDVS